MPDEEDGEGDEPVGVPVADGAGEKKQRKKGQKRIPHRTPNILTEAENQSKYFPLKEISPLN